MPPARGEEMTGSPIRLPRARETGPEDDNDPPPEQTPKQHKPLSISLPSTAPAKRRRRQGPTAATRSGSARALTPTPTSTRPARPRKAAEQTPTTQPLVLTGPSPSGMTWGVPGWLTAIPRDLSHGLLHFLRLEIALCTRVHTDTRYGLPASAACQTMSVSCGEPLL